MDSRWAGDQQPRGCNWGDLMTGFLAAAVLIVPAALCAVALAASAESDKDQVAKLDTEFQAAVKRNDADTMARIFHKDMILVLGNGRSQTQEEQLQEARDKVITYEIQDEEPGTQTVRVHGDTAVVTALLRIKGTIKGAAMDRRVWFSDVYVRTPTGWRYFFGQVSLPLPTD